MITKTNGDEPERQRFELWYLSHPGAKEPDIRRLNNGTYYFPSVQWRLEAWQAALSSKQEEE